jgi:putative OPT family oligopeptide transporter
MDWTSVLIGVFGGIGLIVVDAVLKRTGRGTLPVLAVGIGLYLPPTVGVTLALGAILGWLIDRRVLRRPDGERAQRRGVLIASGFIVGESLVGVGLAAVIGATGNQSPLAVVGDAFAGPASWLGLLVFVGVAVWFARTVTKP